MKYKFLMFLTILNLGCAQSQPQNVDSKEEAKNQILPIKLTIKGQLKQIEDVGLLTPSIHFSIDTNYVEVRVGATEFYNTKYTDTSFDEVLKPFELKDFRSNDYYYNPYFEFMGNLETIKEIDGEEYTRKFSNFKRKDIDVNYLELDSAEIVKFTILSHYINKIAIGILKDNVDKESMIKAKSMSEALKNPENVYELEMKNTSTSLPSEAGQLVNLRVLDISGSQIKSIPKEIENCIQLRSIKANASKLTRIPSSIGNLQKLRNINFAYCQIKELPEEFGKLETLWSLGLGSNQLSDLPESISNLKNVQMFGVFDNNFSEFPNEVLGLECVGNLWMHKNKFKSIPREIVNLKNLHHLLIDASEIENIEEIKSLIPDVRIIDESK